MEKLLALTIALTALAIHAKAELIGDFESPALGSLYYQITPAALPWTFEGFSGIARNVTGASQGAYFAVAGVTQTSQYAFLLSGRFYRTINFASAGPVQLSYVKAGRVFVNGSQGGDLTYSVTIAPVGGGTPVLNITDTTYSSQRFTLTSHRFMVPTAGDYRIFFTSVSGSISHNDDTALFDNLTITPISTNPNLPTASIASYAGIEITGSVGSIYRVQYTLDLTNPTWMDLADVPLPSSPYTYFDPVPINQTPQRFYRVLLAP